MRDVDVILYLVNRNFSKQSIPLKASPKIFSIQQRLLQ